MPDTAPLPTAEPVRTVGPRRRALVLLAVVLALVGTLGAGCVRVRAGMAVSPDDRVSGVVDIATPDGAPGGSGPPLQVPDELSGDVSVERYEQDGYIGSRLRFDDLTFDDVTRVLPAISPSTGQAIRVQMRRSGDRVVVTGQVDLTRVSPESSDVQLKIAFPGEIRQTDGTAAGGVISWTFNPGTVTDVNAVVDYPDPDAPSWVLWALLLLAVVAVAVAIVFLLANSSRTQVHTRARR
ncbi:uncharacterized protein DUF3153 [Actinomycetospora succinea]|uniref:Uncharacterized protein DUF3153 n=1 Tax=Actinomycetospora succinea TaxID=663603 RepID=A0A4V3D9D0_9PSEU|nr:DUF3153 domain-containing protein [Actinomycetospora succinea]TDQ55700.1 uncharacterized protein DUF3153 [Actinomycetospora succinea]